MNTLDLATWQERARAVKLRHQAFINGRFVDAQGGQTFATINPATGQKLADVAACQSSDVDAAVTAARQAFESGVWSRQHPRDRKRVLLRLAALIEQHSEELALLESLDMGKPISDALAYDLPETVKPSTSSTTKLRPPVLRRWPQSPANRWVWWWRSCPGTTR